MAYLTNRNAPSSGLANLLAMKGRMGDTELVHMSKPEIDMLERLGKMTVNPKTGLPEAYSLEEKIAGLESLINMPNPKKAMEDLMEYGKEKLKELALKDMEKEIPSRPEPVRNMPPQMPPQSPGPQTMNLRSGGLVSFGQEIQRQLSQKSNQDIAPFLDEIEGMTKERFGITFDDKGIGGQQPRPMPYTDNPFQGLSNPFEGLKSLTPASPAHPNAIYDKYSRGTSSRVMNPSLREDLDQYADLKKKVMEDFFQVTKKEPEVVKLAGGTRPKDYFEGQVDDARGDGMSDDIGFKVEGDPIIKGAKLSADEYVVPADLVAILGNGSSDAGAKKLDAFTKEMRMKAFGTPKQQRQINATKELKGLV